MARTVGAEGALGLVEEKERFDAFGFCTRDPRKVVLSSASVHERDCLSREPETRRRASLPLMGM